jgi:GrpB-like predicted nucleotidyltransferase (UPF0157 family)
MTMVAILNMIEIVPYNPSWPQEFMMLATPLRRALGDLAVRIDHIGSTSVPNLAAKDVIDVQITARVFDESLVTAMASLGYMLRANISRDHRPPNWVGADSEWEKQFFRAPVTLRRTNTHVRIAGRANQRYALLFRDYLRAHPASAAAYGELKHRLAPLFDDTGAYADVKDPACDLIAVAAEDWARATHWQPGPSDA